MNSKSPRQYTCKVYVCENKVDRWGRLCPLHQKQRDHIVDSGINDVIKEWQDNTPDREQTCASPSSMTECPRVVWFKKHKVPAPNQMGWGKKQRNMLGRVAENVFAMQLKDQGKLLWHWKDDEVGESVKFGMGEGLTRIEGTPDLLIKLGGTVLISDAKTSRADSFTYVPLDDKVWDDFLWYKYKLQVEAYYMLCHKNKAWFDVAGYDEKRVAELYGEATAKVNKPKALPLPEACHLFSYALDDGVVKREFTWKPTQKTAAEILYYVKRWNEAYQSEEMPECQCNETQVKFCQYATQTEATATGYKLGIECCGEELWQKA